MKFTIFRLILVLLFFLLFGSDAQAQIIKEAKIVSVESQTKDGVIIKITTVKDKYSLGEAVVIDYSVKNTNSKTIYLVTNSEIKLWAKDEVLWLESPIRYSNEHESYKYEFVKIAPKQNYKGKIVLDSKKIPIDKDYDKEIWKIQVGFAYLFDIESLENSSIGERAKIWLVAERSVTINIGSLIIEVKN